MSNEDIRVEVTCHEGILVINTTKEQQDKWFIPNTQGRFGCVLIDTEKHLAMSDEAFELLKKIRKGSDSIGDICTWESDQGPCFSWIGGPKKLVQVNQCECSRDGIINFKYNKIDNVIPPEALEAIVRSDPEDEE